MGTMFSFSAVKSAGKQKKHFRCKSIGGRQSSLKVDPVSPVPETDSVLLFLDRSL